MGSDLRIVFMGTPEFSVAPLRAIAEAGHEVVGVITAPDRPAGRGKKVRSSATKQYALEQGLLVLQPTNLKDPVFLQELRSLRANVQVVVAFRMLPKAVWAMPERGTFNLHASLLPHYRGAAPINWAIIHGEQRTGVTTFFIDDKIDTGAIILQREIPIDPKDNAGSLHDKLKELGSTLVLDTLQLIRTGVVEPKAQSQTRGALRTAPKLNRTNCKIDWHSSVNSIYNMIRGLSPSPGAWSILQNDGKEVSMKIFHSKVFSEEHDFTMGKIVLDKGHWYVAAVDGFIELLEVQLPNKKRMKVIDLLNGYKVSENAVLL